MRLLGIADQHQRHVVVERGPQDLPLHRVGVLELVDQHHLAAFTEPGEPRLRRRAAQGVAQPEQLVVEGVDAQPPLACGQFLAHGAGELEPLGEPAGEAVGRHQRGVGQLVRCPRQLARRGQVERRALGQSGVPGEVQVLGHLVADRG